MQNHKLWRFSFGRESKINLNSFQLNSTLYLTALLSSFPYKELTTVNCMAECEQANIVIIPRNGR
jgi:hypothetical protein